MRGVREEDEEEEEEEEKEEDEDEGEEEEEEEDGAPLAYKHIRWHNRRGRYASIWSVL
mgnify:CR=1 FL=1